MCVRVCARIFASVSVSFNVCSFDSWAHTHTRRVVFVGPFIERDSLVLFSLQQQQQRWSPWRRWVDTDCHLRDSVVLYVVCVWHQWRSAHQHSEVSSTHSILFLLRCNIYISRLCYDVSVCLSVTEVHWHIIANLGFKFRSKSTAHCGRGEG